MSPPSLLLSRRWILWLTTGPVAFLATLTESGSASLHGAGPATLSGASRSLPGLGELPANIDGYLLPPACSGSRGCRRAWPDGGSGCRRRRASGWPRGSWPTWGGACAMCLWGVAVAAILAMLPIGSCHVLQRDVRLPAAA